MFLLNFLFPKHFRSFITRKLLFWFYLSISIKFLLMATTVHPDFFFIHLFPNRIVSHGESNVYSLFETELSHRPGFYYTPPVLYFFSAVQFIFSPINPGFSIYMDQAYDLYKNGNPDPLRFLNSHKINYFYSFFLLKVPYIFFDLGLLWLILKMAKRQNAKKIFYLWIFNPLVLYGTYMYGQFDIIQTFMMVYGIYLVIKNKFLWGFLVLGVAATFKNFSLMTIIPTALIIGKNAQEKVKFTFIGFLPFILSTLFVYIQAPTQAIYTLIPKYFILKTSQISSLYANISKFTRFAILGISYLSALFLANTLKIDKINKIIGLSLFSLIAFFAFSPIILFHYLLVVTPFMFIYFQDKPFLIKSFFLYIGTAAIFKLWTPLQQLGLFAPINNKLLTETPSLSQMIEKVIPYTYVSSLSYIVFFILSLFFLFQILKDLIFQSEIK